MFFFIVLALGVNPALVVLRQERDRRDQRILVPFPKDTSWQSDVSKRQFRSSATAHAMPGGMGHGDNVYKSSWTCIIFHLTICVSVTFGTVTFCDRHRDLARYRGGGGGGVPPFVSFP